MKAKYVIETPPLSPVKLHLEIPIGEMTDEEIRLKIEEIKAKTEKLPSYVINELKKAIKNLPKIPNNIKRLLVGTKLF